MQIVTLQEIESITSDKSAVINAVRQGFVNHHRGLITLPQPVQMLFHNADNTLAGDCHVKCASSGAYPYFCVKVASGFYANEARGLPVNNGMVLLISSESGQPLAVFQDQGHFTSVRTAAAGALAAKLVSRQGKVNLGIVGTGHQAELQARWICEYTTLSGIQVWGRSDDKARRLAHALDGLPVEVEAATSLAELCEFADVIVTTTPSTTPVLTSDVISPGHSIVALGADSPGKIELDVSILARANNVLTDDHEQCLHHGEFGNAVRAQTISADSDRSFGAFLANQESLELSTEAISVVDLTGLGAQDLAVASLVWERLN